MKNFAAPLLGLVVMSGSTFAASAQTASEIELKLRNAKIGFQRIDLFEVDDVGPGAEIGADADFAQAGNAVERRGDAHLFKARLGERDVGLRTEQAGARLVQRFHRPGITRNESLSAIEVRLCEIQTRLRLRKRRPLDRVVEPHHDLAAAMEHAPAVGRRETARLRMGSNRPAEPAPATD